MNDCHGIANAAATISMESVIIISRQSLARRHVVVGWGEWEVGVVDGVREREVGP